MGQGEEDEVREHLKFGHTEVHRKSPWKPFPNVWTRMWLGVGSKDLWRGNHAWPTWKLFAMRWGVWWMRRQSWMVITILTWLMTVTHIASPLTKWWSTEDGRSSWQWCCHQRDVNRLRKWTYRDLMKFSKGKCQLLHLGRKNPNQQYMLGADQLKSSFAEKNLGVWVKHKSANKANIFLSCIRRSITRRARGWSFPSAQHCWDTSVGLGPLLGSPVKKSMDILE